MTLYRDPFIKKIFELIDANDGGAIKTFYYGDPIFIPKSDLPALCGFITRTEVVDTDVGEDEHKAFVTLTLITDIRDHFMDTPDKIQVGWQALNKIFEERDSNYKYVSTALMDILRANAELGNNAHIDTKEKQMVDYRITVGKRGEGTWAWEGNLSLVIYFSQLRE